MKDHIIRGLVPIKDETFTFTTGTYTYSLLHTPVSPSSDNFEIYGTMNGIPHVFVLDTDYTISGNSIVWDSDEDNPDNQTTCYVDYIYQGTKSGVSDEDEASLLMIRINAFANALDDLYNDMERTHYAGYVETATGSSLEKISAIVGGKRTAASKATGTLKLTFTQAATVGDPVTVSANNRFSTRSSSTQDAIQFETTTGSSWSTGETFGYIGIQALVAGRGGMVGSNTIINMVDNITNVESVTNPSSTTDGYNKEPDNDFRDRVPLAKESKGKSTPNAFEYDLLKVPGVDKVKLRENWFATADSAIFVVPDSFPPSATLQGRIDGVLSSGRSMGLKARAQYPNVINTWFTVTLERIPTSDSGSVFKTASGDLFSYVQGLGLQERFLQQQFNRALLQNNDVVRIKSFTISETGNTDLWINNDEVLRVGYRASGTGNSLGVFNEAESISCSGDYSTGWISPLGLDTYASGLSVYANDVNEIFGVYLSGNTLCTAGTDYTLYASGYMSSSSFFGRNWNCIEWLSGATNYPLNGTLYSVMYSYNAIEIDVTSTGDF